MCLPSAQPTSPINPPQRLTDCHVLNLIDLPIVIHAWQAISSLGQYIPGAETRHRSLSDEAQQRPAHPTPAADDANPAEYVPSESTSHLPPGREASLHTLLPKILPELPDDEQSPRTTENDDWGTHGDGGAAAGESDDSEASTSGGTSYETGDGRGDSSAVPSAAHGGAGSSRRDVVRARRARVESILGDDDLTGEHDMARAPAAALPAASAAPLTARQGTTSAGGLTPKVLKYAMAEAGEGNEPAEDEGEEDAYELARARTARISTAAPIASREQERQLAIRKFNSKAKAGINYLLDRGVLPKKPEAVADFLRDTKGLSKRRIGDYLGESAEFTQVPPFRLHL